MLYPLRRDNFRFSAALSHMDLIDNKYRGAGRGGVLLKIVHAARCLSPGKIMEAAVISPVPHACLIQGTPITVLSVSVTPTENIALRKRTEQKGGGNTAALAIDGKTEPRGQCTRTSFEMNPWWLVRLEAIYTIISVAIFTPECCGK